MPCLRPHIEHILPLVEKPNRYLGNEINVIRKRPEDVAVQVVLAFPDVYEIGQSYLGFEILYHVINRRGDALAERVFAPWVDMEAQMRKKGIPLFALESLRPLSAFDIVGFTLHYELGYTNVLNMLDLASIPLRTEERGEGDPLVLAGGPCAYNPEPLSPFLDAVVVGDGEEVIEEIIDAVKAGRAQGKSRRELLRTLTSIEGVYVPAFYEAIYGDDGAFQGLHPAGGLQMVDGGLKSEIRNPKSEIRNPREEGIPRTIQARWTPELHPEYYPARPLVPLIHVTHDRLSVEIMRGCTRGCRFCSAGMIYRPVRERPPDDILNQVQRTVGATGVDEVSMLSLSTSDYGHIADLVEQANVRLSGQRVAISLPSLRPDTFSLALAEQVSRVRKSGLTFAPEAGTQRLRNVINKNLVEEDLLRTVELAYGKGWNLIKLYFMIGLPTETQEDLNGIVDLARKVADIGRKQNARNGAIISISPFSPKPNTPFQWDAQEDLEVLKEKCAYLDRWIRFKGAQLKWRNPEVTVVESVLARGDRRMADVVFAAWQRGAKFDEWSEHFDFERWMEAFQEGAIDLHREIGPRRLGDPFPWDHIRCTVDQTFLWRERERASRGEVTPDCRTGICHACGTRVVRSDGSLCGFYPSLGEENHTAVPPKKDLYGRRAKRRSGQPDPLARTRLRLQYAKGTEVRFIAHLDVIRAFDRAIRRARIPIAYSQGFHPHPKLSFGPPLPLGIMSEAEYVDLQLSDPYPRDIRMALNSVLPTGLRVQQAKPIFGKTAALNAVINRVDYRVSLQGDMNLNGAVAELMAASEVVIRRVSKGQEKEVNIRPGICTLVLSDANGHDLYMSLTLGEPTSPRPMEVLEHLLKWSIERLLSLRITRTGLYVERDGRRMTPMELV